MKAIKGKSKDAVKRLRPAGKKGVKHKRMRSKEKKAVKRRKRRLLTGRVRSKAVRKPRPVSLSVGQQAFNEGYDQGYTQGFAQGMQDGQGYLQG